MYDLGTLFSGLALSEEDLGGLLEEDGDYGAAKKRRKKKLFSGRLVKKAKAGRKARVEARKSRRAGRKDVRASGLRGKERREALRASRQEAAAQRKADRMAAGLRARKPLGRERRLAEKHRLAQLRAQKKGVQARVTVKGCPPDHKRFKGKCVPLPVYAKLYRLAQLRAQKKGVQARVTVKGCPPDHKRFKGKCVPLPVYAKLLGTQAKIAAARKAASVRTSLPTTSAEALAAATSAAASYDNYAPSASYQDEAYSEQAYSEQTYTDTPSYDTSSYSSEMPDSGAYWEGGGAQVASYAPASIDGGEEGYEDEEYADEESSKTPLILGAVAVLALGGVGFYVYKKRQAGADEEPAFTETLSEEEGA